MDAASWGCWNRARAMRASKSLRASVAAAAAFALLVAFALLGAAPAHAATGWQSPVTLSPAGDGGETPQVVLDSAGDAVASWIDFPSAGGYAMDAARLPSGGSWSTPATLASTSGSMQSNQLAGDGRGDAVADWEEGTAAMSASYAGSSGTWGTAVSVGATGFPSGLGMDSSGDVVGLFHTCPACGGTGANNGLAEATLPFGGSWSSLSVIAGYGSGAGDANAAVLAENASGEAVTAWDQGDGPNTNMAAEVLPSGPSTGTSMDLANSPVITVNAAGDSTIVYSDGLSAYVPLESITYDAGTRTWGSVEPIGNTPTFGESTYAVAIDGAGDATAVWRQQTQNSSAQPSIEMATLAAGATSWSAPQTLSPATSASSEPAIAEDASGDRIVVWYATENAGASNPRTALEGAVAPAGAGFEAAQTVATPVQATSPPEIAIDPHGNAVAVWEGTNSTIEAASFLARAPSTPPGSGGGSPAPPGNPTPPGSGAPAPTAFASVKLAGSPALTAKGAKVKLTCSAPAGQSCQVTETLSSVETLVGGKPVGVAATARRTRRTVVVGRKSVTIAAGRTATVTLTLNARGRALLRRFARLPAKLTVGLRRGAHTATVATRRLTFRKPRPR
jgi:hypothetical protein